MAIELDHPFSTTKPIDESFAAIEAGGQGRANADVTFQLNDGGGTVHTSAQITGKAASMGEGVVIGVVDGPITYFTGNLGQI